MRLLALLASNCVTLDKLLHLSGQFLSKSRAWFLCLGVPGRTLRSVWWWQSGYGHIRVTASHPQCTDKPMWPPPTMAQTQAGPGPRVGALTTGASEEELVWEIPPSWGWWGGAAALRVAGPQQRGAPAHVTHPQQGGTVGPARARTCWFVGSGSCPHLWGGPVASSPGTFPLISAPWDQDPVTGFFTQKTFTEHLLRPVLFQELSLLPLGGSQPASRPRTSGCGVRAEAANASWHLLCVH